MFGGRLGRSDVEGLSGMGGIGLLVGVVGLVIDLSVIVKEVGYVVSTTHMYGNVDAAAGWGV